MRIHVTTYVIMIDIMLLPKTIPIYSDFVYYHSPTVHDEVDIVGQDGHIYKGRMGRSRLPPLAHVSYTVDHISHRTKYYKSR